tara:strand:- start:29 stop:709 length:681 start_codon:yes stop_codon:yes gene_type:complete
MEKLSKFKRLYNKVYYNLFVENTQKKIDFNFPDNLKRWDLVQEIIRKKKYKKYLEIGCDDDQLFSKIDLELKIGVDPVSGGNVRSTSDVFFESNNENFDIVFIDGLHEYDQVKKDIINSLNFLNNDGIILLHDCLPSEMSLQAVPRYRHKWNGDVWKALVEFRKHKNLEIFTCKIDYGISMIKKKENSDILLDQIKNYKNLKFLDFYNNHKRYMRILEYEKFLDKI